MSDLSRTLTEVLADLGIDFDAMTVEQIGKQVNACLTARAITLDSAFMILDELAIYQERS